jgi:ornithine carbamoyltransferase
MKARHVLSVADIGAEKISKLVNDALVFASARGGWKRRLEGKVVGIYFRGTSTRTRTSFTVAAMKLGADIITYGPNDLQTATGETLADTARVLSGYLDVLVIRTNGSIEEMKTLASQDRMAVVNAMSSNEHPTQALADLLTIREKLGRLDDVHILYLGEGNNSAAALALVVGMMPGMSLTLVTPEGYGLPEDVLEKARGFAKQSHSVVEQYHDMNYLPRNVDVVYTTRWQTMGVPKAEPDWQQRFWPYRVTRELMAKVSRPSGTIFLHDLPAVRGAEVTDEVLDGPQSVAFRQAENKLNSALAVLSWCVSQSETTPLSSKSEQTRSRRTETFRSASNRQ